MTKAFYYAPDAQHRYYQAHKERHKRYAQQWKAQFTLEEWRAKCREWRCRHRQAGTARQIHNTLYPGEEFDPTWPRRKSIKHETKETTTDEQSERPEEPAAE